MCFNVKNPDNKVRVKEDLLCLKQMASVEERASGIEEAVSFHTGFVYQLGRKYTKDLWNRFRLRTLWFVSSFIDIYNQKKWVLEGHGYHSYRNNKIDVLVKIRNNSGGLVLCSIPKGSIVRFEPDQEDQISSSIIILAKLPTRYDEVVVDGVTLGERLEWELKNSKSSDTIGFDELKKILFPTREQVRKYKKKEAVPVAAPSAEAIDWAKQEIKKYESGAVRVKEDEADDDIDDAGPVSDGMTRRDDTDHLMSSQLNATILAQSLEQARPLLEELARKTTHVTETTYSPSHSDDSHHSSGWSSGHSSHSDYHSSSDSSSYDSGSSSYDSSSSCDSGSSCDGGGCD